MISIFTEQFSGTGILLEEYISHGNGRWIQGLYTPGGIWVITSNKLRISILNGSLQRPVRDTGISFALGTEVYCDISVPGSNVDVAFLFAAKNNADSYVARLQTAAALVRLQRLAGPTGVFSDSVQATTTWSINQSRRLGITVLDAVTPVIQLWEEPVGGGVRTIKIAAWTPTQNFLSDAAVHGGVGFMSSGAPVGTTFDDLTVAVPGVLEIEEEEPPIEPFCQGITITQDRPEEVVFAITEEVNLRLTDNEPCGTPVDLSGPLARCDHAEFIVLPLI